MAARRRDTRPFSLDIPTKSSRSQFFVTAHPRAQEVWQLASLTRSSDRFLPRRHKQRLLRFLPSSFKNSLVFGETKRTERRRGLLSKTAPCVLTEHRCGLWAMVPSQ